MRSPDISDLRAAEAKSSSVPPDQPGAANVGDTMVAQDDEVQSDVGGDVDDRRSGRDAIAESGVNVDGADVFAFSHQNGPCPSSGARPRRRRPPGERR